MTALIPLMLATLFLPQSPANQNSPAPPAAYPIGQGVTAPVLVHETKPNYTAEAMRARIQGIVVLECVVMPDGSELGPLDMQLRIRDEVGELGSGLTPVQALTTLRSESFRLFDEIFKRLRYTPHLRFSSS